VISLMSTCLFWASPVQSQPSSPCVMGNAEQPPYSATIISDREYGFWFLIPGNYITQKNRLGDELYIHIQNPAEVAFRECVQRERIRGKRPPWWHLVKVELLPDNIRSVADIRREVESSMNPRTHRYESEILELERIQISDLPAIIYTVQSIAPMPGRAREAKLIHPNGQHLVTISLGYEGLDYEKFRQDWEINSQVMDKIISTMSINF